ncbi:hypothetical protein [Polymorphobacter sp.]|uniref:hypothetical protein n=1 Tax=Polymorphobacter sp. TaxID=1909290 RepID=UPI003F6FDE90
MTRAKPLPRAADPVVVRQIETRRECPAELLADVTPAPARPKGGWLEGDRPTIGWVARLKAYAEDLRTRLLAARAECPQPGAPR